jgi:hypothetical protein
MGLSVIIHLVCVALASCKPSLGCCRIPILLDWKWFEVLFMLTTSCYEYILPYYNTPSNLCVQGSQTLWYTHGDGILWFSKVSLPSEDVWRCWLWSHPTSPGWKKPSGGMRQPHQKDDCYRGMRSFDQVILGRMWWSWDHYTSRIARCNTCIGHEVSWYQSNQSRF